MLTGNLKTNVPGVSGKQTLRVPGSAGCAGREPSILGASGSDWPAESGLAETVGMWRRGFLEIVLLMVK